MTADNECFMVFRILAFNVFLPAARQIKPADLVIDTQTDRKHREAKDCSEEGMDGGSQESGGASMDDAVSFMERVKARFCDNPTLVDQFVKTLEDLNEDHYQGRKQKASDAVRGIVALLGGQHDGLLAGLKAFLPNDLQANVEAASVEAEQIHESDAPTVDPAAIAEGTEPKESVNGEQQQQQQQQQQQSDDSSMDGAVSFMESVGSRFADRPEVIDQFMKALEDINQHCSHGRKQKALDAVQRIVTLFRGQHNDLLMGLKPFVPFLPELAAQKVVAATEAQSDSVALDGDAELGPRESPAADQGSATAPASVLATSLCPPATGSAGLSRRVSLQPLHHEEARSGPTRLASLYHRRPIAAINQPSAASGGTISVSTRCGQTASAGRSAGPSPSDMELEETLP